MNPGNGTVVVVRGDMATYSCNDGFDLVGVSVRVCGDDGEWSDEAPMCIRKYTVISQPNVMVCSNYCKEPIYYY